MEQTEKKHTVNEQKKLPKEANLGAMLVMLLTHAEYDCYIDYRLIDKSIDISSVLVGLDYQLILQIWDYFKTVLPISYHYPITIITLITPHLKCFRRI